MKGTVCPPLLLLLCAAAAIATSPPTFRLEGSVLEARYEFPAPVLEADRTIGPDLRHRILLPGAPSLGAPGEPALPRLPVRLLLPPDTEVERLEVVAETPAPLPGRYQIAWVQEPSPLSRPGSVEATRPDPVIYAGQAPYPAELLGNFHLQAARGFRVLCGVLHPVQIIPVRGQVLSYRSVRLRVHLRPARSIQGVLPRRDRPEDRAWVEEQVQNPAGMARYPRSVPPGEGSPGETGPVDLVIITTAELAAYDGVNSLPSLASFHQTRGCRTRLTTVEEIEATYQGTDRAERIRQYLIELYQTDELRSVLLVGDADGGSGQNSIPARGLWVMASPQFVDANIPADCYYSNLDGSWNHDGDELWGEPGDGPDGGEVDLLAELAVGRACVDDLVELRSFVAKTIQFASTPAAMPHLRQARMLGEILWPGDPPTYGGNYKDEIRQGSTEHGLTTAGFPTDWEVSMVYDRNGSPWTGAELAQQMSTNLAVVYNHIGHAGVLGVMRLTPSMVSGLTNPEPFVVYSQGCYAGSFDNRDDSEYGAQDCMAEVFTLSQHGAVAAVMNSRFGWASRNSTFGPSQIFDREFFDALFGEEIPTLGRAHADAKEDCIPFLNWAHFRWCYYQLNLFGDPELALTGVTANPASLAFDRPQYDQGQRARLLLVEEDLNGDPDLNESCSIKVRCSSGDHEELALIETSPDSGQFQGDLSVLRGEPQPGDHILQGQDGDRLSASYRDADDGSGQGATRTCTALLRFTLGPPGSLGSDSLSTSTEPEATGERGSADEEGAGASLELWLNQREYRGGDPFRLVCLIRNPGPPVDLHRFIVLDLWGTFLYWPDWSPWMRGERLLIPPGIVGPEEILSFSWPEGVGSGEGLRFWGAVIDGETGESWTDPSVVEFAFR